MNHSQVIIIVLIVILFSNCQSYQEDSGLIDYGQLDEIQAEIVMDIGVDDDFTAGQLKDLVLMPDGTFFVSDLGKPSIEQFNNEGKHVAVIARGGEGPGELPSFFSLFDA